MHDALSEVGQASSLRESAFLGKLEALPTMKRQSSYRHYGNSKGADGELTQIPSIVYIHSHDTGRHIRPYGHAYDTPILPRFAQQGVPFRNAFAAAPNCSPSRASLLTGEYPDSNGMHGLDHRRISGRPMVGRRASRGRRGQTVCSD